MSAGPVAKPRRRKPPLSSAERTELGMEYRLVMEEPPSLAGGGWPALWESEDLCIRNQGLPDPDSIEWGDSAAADLSKALVWFVDGPPALKMPPWTWTPHDGALADPFARALRWAWHHGYPQPAEMVAEDWTARLLEQARARKVAFEGEWVERLVREVQQEPNAAKEWVWQALKGGVKVGRAIERDAQRKRMGKLRVSAPGKGGRPPKGLPRGTPAEKESRRNIRRAVLVKFLSTRGLRISHDDYHDTFRSVFDAVALAETVREQVVMRSPPGQPDLTVAFCGEAAVSLLVHTVHDPKVGACEEIAKEAWQAAEEISEAKQQHGVEAARALWGDRLAELGNRTWEPARPGAGYGYETVRKTWQRFRPAFDSPPPPSK